MRRFKLLCAVWVLCGCGQNSQLDQAEIEKRAEEILLEREHQAELARIEAIKQVEEQEQIAKMAAEKREQIAADLSTREGAAEARRLANLEIAATEMARRETAAIEVKSFVDSLEIVRSTLNGNTTLRINGETAYDNMKLTSPAGYSVNYQKQEGDSYFFGFEEEAFQVSLQRTAKGISFAKVVHKKPLAEGVPIEDGKPFVIPSSLPSFSILKATYGADTVQRDVKDLVKAKVQNGRLEFSAHSGELGGDPIFGRVKTFYVKYLHRGKIYEKSFREGERVMLP